MNKTKLFVTLFKHNAFLLPRNMKLIFGSSFIQQDENSRKDPPFLLLLQQQIFFLFFLYLNQIFEQT